MNKIRLNILLAVVTVLVTPTVYASVNVELMNCSKFDSGVARLDCFDNIVKKIKSKNTTFPSDQTNLLAKKTHTNQNTKSTTLDKSDLQFPITANLLGELSDWDKNTTFKLNNGQIWKVIRSNTRAHKLSKAIQNPKVTIRKAIFGSHTLRIEGVSQKFKVKRIK